MTATPELRTTPLHATYRELGATLSPFGGWEMPLWYKAGAIREHLSVVQHAGLFDTSHMDHLVIEGEKARDFLNYAFTRDLADAAIGRCLYGAFLDDNGHCLDDGLIYPMADNRFVVVINASQAEPICAHLLTLPGAGAVNIFQPEKRLVKLDLQGPASPRILKRLVANHDEVFARFPYFTFKGDFDMSASNVELVDGIPVLISRTGYTGEVGFELFLPAESGQTVWNLILNSSDADQVLPCGLAARDSLRTGAVLALSHQDIGPWPFINHPWRFALPFGNDGKTFTKKFHGDSALDADKAAHTLPFVGFDPRRVDPHDAVVIHDGKEIGTVTTVVSDMAVGRVGENIVSLSSPDKPADWNPKGLACGFVRVDSALPIGTEIALKDKRRTIKAVISADIRPARTARMALSRFFD